jgi:hypothetical protein
MLYAAIDIHKHAFQRRRVLLKSVSTERGAPDLGRRGQ